MFSSFCRQEREIWKPLSPRLNSAVNVICIIAEWSEVVWGSFHQLCTYIINLSRRQKMHSIVRRKIGSYDGKVGLTTKNRSIIRRKIRGSFKFPLKHILFLVLNRVARCFDFIPKIQIWVYCGRSWNGKCRYVLWPLGKFSGHLVKVMAVWCSLCSFGILFPVWVCLGQEKSGNPGPEQCFHVFGNAESSWGRGEIRSRKSVSSQPRQLHPPCSYVDSTYVYPQAFSARCSL
jgi:hypothetical protein